MVTPKRADLAKAKAKKAVKQPRVKSIKKSKSQKKEKKSVKRIIVSDRKAKIDAAKTIHQLFSKDKQKDSIYMDGKLIYL